MNQNKPNFGKMKAAVIEDIQKIIYKEDYPKPSPGPDEALVKVHYCGICGSDITNFKYKMYNFPLVMGHEITGIVEELGENIKKVKIGSNCVIGAGAIIMPGVTFEDDVIIAAGAVVTQDQVLKKGNIYAGIPAKSIKKK